MKKKKYYSLEWWNVYIHNKLIRYLGLESIRQLLWQKIYLSILTLHFHLNQEPKPYNCLYNFILVSFYFKAFLLDRKRAWFNPLENWEISFKSFRQTKVLSLLPRPSPLKYIFESAILFMIQSYSLKIKCKSTYFFVITKILRMNRHAEHFFLFQSF